MPTNLRIDDELIERARQVGRHRTGRAAIHAALRAYVRHREQTRIVEMFGTVDTVPAREIRSGRAPVVRPRATRDSLSHGAKPAPQGEESRPLGR